MMKKKLVTVLSAALALTLAVGLFAACGEKEDDPNKNDPTETELTDGIFISEDSIGGRGYNYIRFHDDGVFYYAFLASSANKGGTTVNAGYYEIVEEEMDFIFQPGTATVATQLTADSYVKFTNFDGSACNICGDTTKAEAESYTTNIAPIADDTLYGVYYNNVKYIHDTDPDYALSDETPQVIAEFFGDSAIDSLTINHNGFRDDINGIEGTWTYDITTRTYTLKTAENETASLVVSADGKTATYTYDGDTVTLNAPAEEQTALSIADATGMFTLTFEKDGTYKVVASMGGQTMTMKEGEWSFAMHELVIDGGSPIYPDADTHAATVSFTLTTSGGGEMAASFTVNSEGLAWLNENSVKKVLGVQDATTMFTLELYDNGTYKVIASMGGQTAEIKSGTWAWSVPSFTLDDGDPIYPDGTTHALTVVLNVDIEQMPTVTFTIGAEDLSKL